MSRPRILIVDDDEFIRTQMKWALAQDYEVHLAEDPVSAFEAVKRINPSLAVLDLGLPPRPEGISEGLELLSRITQFDPRIKVIVATGNPDKSAGLQAISLGAHDFFTKPVDIDEIKLILKRAHYVYTLEAEYAALQKELETKALGDMVGSCQKMQEIFATIRKIAPTDVPVLITGESGTGKEVLAWAIHNQSLRQKMPFVPINCGAIPENLMESELFGHEKGAFTGAHARRMGRIELARGGTLFLDEIGDLPLPLQVKLLRFLQDHRVERIGGRETIEVDVRVFAATNRDLKRLVEEGRFREDLYYRLAVVQMELPPLRDRGDDVAMLANSFLKRYEDASKGQKALSPAALKAIGSYRWPGNVRELENRIRRAIAFSEGPAITPRDLGFEGEWQAAEAQDLNLKKGKEDIELKLISAAMARHGGNITKAAEDLGVTRASLYNLLKKFGLMKEEA